jgi:hypothetical protein
MVAWVYMAKPLNAAEIFGLAVLALADVIGKSPGYISRIEVRGEIPSVDKTSILLGFGLSRRVIIAPKAR